MVLNTSVALCVLAVQYGLFTSTNLTDVFGPGGIIDVFPVASTANITANVTTNYSSSPPTNMPTPTPTTTTPTAAPTATSSKVGDDSQKLRDTFAIYGSVMGVGLLLFCLTRKLFPRPYTIRHWTTNEDLKTRLAADQYGWFSWLWLLNALTDDEIMEECGMDPLCIIRVLKMGFRLCLLGAFNAIWLMPLYKTSGTSSDTIIEVTIANVPSQSSRFVATALASYMLFGYTMYLILKEFEWFRVTRHKFLSKKMPCNYSIYVRNVPIEYRSNAGLVDYFCECFSTDKVLEANLRVRVPELTRAIFKRDALVTKLENALAYEDATGKTSTHSEGIVLRKKVKSIPTYAKVLSEGNMDVKARVEAINEKVHGASLQYDAEKQARLRAEQTEMKEAAVPSGGETPASEPNISLSKGLKTLSKGATSLASTASAGAGSLGAAARSVVKRGEDGGLYSGGFVSFSDLSTTNAALQMIHHPVPFTMEVRPAPNPYDIFWANVGREHQDLQLGMLFSAAATAALCLFWTFPMSFIASLSNIDALKQQLGFVKSMIDALPFLQPLLQQLAPLFVIVLNSLLPVILNFLSMFEGPVSGSVVQASVFSKLAAFMIVQTFFVSAISGGILKEIHNLIKSPTKIINLLATSLPAQSTYFMQIVFVGTTLLVVMEMLRIGPVVFALIRKFVGPKLTEKQRQKKFLIFRPLADPTDFAQADNMAKVCVLYFMVLLVYQVNAPLTSFVLGFVFLLLQPIFLHQFVYIYPTHPDSGGIIWTSFVGILLTCMLIAEITILGLLALKQAAVATALMLPLIIITVLFNVYIKQEHFRVTAFLPSREALKMDRANGDDMDRSFIAGAYIQEELRAADALPENLSEGQAEKLGLEVIDPPPENELSSPAVTEILRNESTDAAGEAKPSIEVQLGQDQPSSRAEEDRFI